MRRKNCTPRLAPLSILVANLIRARQIRAACISQWREINLDTLR
jgi:hypothetical protein